MTDSTERIAKGESKARQETAQARDLSNQAMLGNQAALFALNGLGAEMCLRSTEAMFRAMAAMNQEIADFAGRRVRAGLDAVESMMQSRDMGRSFDVQLEFMRQATTDYFEETQRLLDLAAQVTRESWSPVQGIWGAAASEAAKTARP